MGTNEWEQDEHGRFHRTKTTYLAEKTKPNRHERRKAIDRKARRRAIYWKHRGATPLIGA